MDLDNRYATYSCWPLEKPLCLDRELDLAKHTAGRGGKETLTVDWVSQVLYVLGWPPTTTSKPDLGMCSRKMISQAIG